MTFLLPSVEIDPIHQFKVTKWLDLNIGGVDLSFTNASNSICACFLNGIER